MTKKEEILKGIPAAPGVTIGQPYFLDRGRFNIQYRTISEEDIPKEIVRFEEALTQTRSEILRIQRKVSEQMGREHAEIFGAHLLVIEDRTLIENVLSRIKKEKLVSEYIFLDVLKKYMAAFSKIEDEYLKDRVADIEDVGKRILRNLTGQQHLSLREKICNKT